MRSGLTPSECARLRELLAAQEALSRSALTPNEPRPVPNKGTLGTLRIKLKAHVSALRSALARAAKGGR